MIRRALIVVAVSGMLLATSASAESLSDIVAKMPARDFAQGAPLIAQIIKAGPAGLKELCGMITPPENVDDAKARFALHGAVLYARRPGAETERAMVEKALLDAMAGAKQADVKQFFIHHIELCGSDAAAKPLGKLLGDKRLCEPATRALLRIGSDGAIAELRAALAGATGARLITIVRALGKARDKASAKAIAKYAASDETTLRHVAWFALASIGDASSTGVLAKASEEYYLLLARRIGQGGDKATCAKICRGLLATRTKPADGNTRCAALTVLASVLGGEAVDDVLAGLDDKSAYVRDRAARLLGGMKASGASVKLIARFKTASPTTRVAIIGALGMSGDKDKRVIDTLTAAASDENKLVRIAAVGALAGAAPEKCVQAATAVMELTDAEELAAAKRVLLRVKAKGLSASAADALDKASTEGKVAILDVLAARGSADQTKAVIVQLDSKEASVRQGAARAMGALAGAGDITTILEKLMAATDSREQASLRIASISAIRRTGAGAKPVVKAMSGAAGARRAVLLGVLSGIGGADALALVVKDTASSDKDTKEAAVRALASWPEMGAAESLLALASKSDNRTHRTLAIRGYVRLISLPSNRTAAQSVNLFAEALKAAPGPVEKKLILGGLAPVRTVEAMALAMEYLDDPELREEAAMAAVKIACPTGRRQKLLKGPEVRKNLEKIIAVAKNKWTRDTAGKYVGRK